VYPRRGEEWVRVFIFQEAIVMAKGTKIEWADDTVNAEMGCDGCELWDPKNRVHICYAGVQTERMLSRGPLTGWPPAFDQPTIFPGRIAQAVRWRDLTGTKRPDKPWLDGMPRVIFLNDMGDTFTASLPDDWLAPELPVMAASPHFWLFLTKRPDRQRAFSLRHELPSNVWAGTSITSPQDQRLRHLMRTRAAVRWASYEPMLAAVDWRPWLEQGLNWLIVGGESGPDFTPMDLSWLVDTVEQCRAAGVPLFVKQDSARRPGMKDRIPDELWVREYPKGYPGRRLSDIR
jgi:protein gp37